MPQVNVGTFTLSYTLFTNAQPGFDIQFGMDFTVTSNSKKALTQLIFPATAVGTNQANVWNVDNHAAPGNIQSVVFSNAANGVIADGPREIVRVGLALVRTKFAVFIVDIQSGAVQKNGISFSYSINPSDQTPITVFEGAQAQIITNEQKNALLPRFQYLKFS